MLLMVARAWRDLRVLGEHCAFKGGSGMDYYYGGWTVVFSFWNKDGRRQVGPTSCPMVWTNDRQQSLYTETRVYRERLRVDSKDLYI